MEATGAKTLADLKTLDAALRGQCDAVEPWIGVGCSAKRLEHPSLGGANSPSLNELANMTAFQLDVLRLCLHYSPASSHEAGRELTLLREKVPGIETAYALQLNCPALNAESLTVIRQTLPTVLVLVQLPIYRMTETAIDAWLGDLGRFGRHIDGVLVDGSGGRGTAAMRDAVDATRTRVSRVLPRSIVGVAGGFTVDDLQTLSMPADDTTPLVDCTTGVQRDGQFCSNAALRWYCAGQAAAEGARAP